MSARSKATRITLGFLVLGLFTFASAQAVKARNAKEDFAAMIKAHEEQFEDILNANAAPQTLMKFLHERVSDEAQIHLRVHNHDIKDLEAMDVQLSKADYINSFLYGPRQVKNYRADIQTLDVKVDLQTNTAKSKEILTESGTMQNPYDYKDKGRDFTSRTTCESEYSLNEQSQLILKASRCRTDIAYETDV